MNLLLILVSIILFLTTLFYLWWSKVKRYWADRDVPHLPPVLFLGSMTFLLRENMGYWLQRMYKQFDSPYVGVWIFWRPGILINSPTLAKNILTKDFDVFRNRFLSSGGTDPIGSLNIFTANDDLWTNIRKQLGGLYTGAKLRNFQDYIRVKAKELVQRIHNEGHNKFDIMTIFADYTTDVIGTTAFGIKCDATLTGAGPIRDITNDFSRYSLYRSIGECSIFFFPELVDIFRFKFFPTSAIEYFKKIFNKVLSQREINEKSKDAKDLMDFLINIKKENESISNDVLIAQAAIFLLGGYDTTAGLLTFATYELAYNPEIQEKLYEELLEAKRCTETDSIHDFDMTTLAELPYLNGVIKETLRMYNTMGWIDRIASEDYKVDDNLTIEAGTVVYINSFGIQLDPKYYPDPHKFDPERFLPENRHNLVPHTFLPFGEGPRGCIGKRFGNMTAQFALAHVLLKYKILPYPDSPKPSEIKISTKNVWFFPAEDVHVQFIPR